MGSLRGASIKGHGSGASWIRLLTNAWSHPPSSLLRLARGPIRFQFGSLSPFWDAIAPGDRIFHTSQFNPNSNGPPEFPWENCNCAPDNSDSMGPFRHQVDFYNLSRWPCGVLYVGLRSGLLA